MSVAHRAWITLAVATLVAGCAAANAPVSQGPPSLPPGMTIECGDVPEPRCTALGASYSSMAGRPVTEVVIRCSRAPCTSTDGQAEIGMLTADGVRTVAGESWGSPSVGVQPAHPVSGTPPVCERILLAKCQEMSGASDLPPGAPAVLRTVVSCSTTCTLTKGEGQTIVYFRDGTRMSFSWGYEGG